MDAHTRGDALMGGPTCELTVFVICTPAGQIFRITIQSRSQVRLNPLYTNNRYTCTHQLTCSRPEHRLTLNDRQGISLGSM